MVRPPSTGTERHELVNRFARWLTGDAPPARWHDSRWNFIAPDRLANAGQRQLDDGRWWISPGHQLGRLADHQALRIN